MRTASSWCSRAAVVQGAALAEGDHFFGDRTSGFGLGQRGRDAFVFDEAANQVGQHGVAMLAGAAKFGGSFKVAHANWWLHRYIGTESRSRVAAVHRCNYVTF